jgi:cytochrome c-type biogenesis protein
MEPVTLALEEKYGRDVTFIIVDVDDPEGWRLLEKFNVRFIPIFFYIDQNGNIVGEDTGYSTFQQKEKRMLDLLAKITL